MLIVAGEIQVEPEGRDEFLEAVRFMVEATLEEPGCVRYAFTPDPIDDGLVRLYELWESQEALEGHFASAHMAEWQEVQPTLRATGSDIKKYLISAVGPVR